MEFNLIYVIDLFATFIFGISGSFRAIRYELDIFGLLILSIITGIGGGLIRDIIFNINPIIFIDYNYILIGILAGLISILFKNNLAKKWNIINYLDAIGLSLFTIIGCNKVFNNIIEYNYFAIIFSGIITSIGGGIIRDIIVNRIPDIFKEDVYASISLIGSIIYIVMFKYFNCINDNVKYFIIFIIILILRILVLKYNLNLIIIKKLEKSPSTYFLKKD